MSKILNLSIIFMLAMPLTSKGQGILFWPESVVFDTLYDRYLISNWGNGNIVQKDIDNNYSNFNTQLSCTGGLEIVGTVVYVASNNSPVHGVAGFDLTTGMMIFSVPITGLVTSTDLTSDQTEYLYLSDVDGNAIYKISISTQTYSILANSGVNQPNGLLYDGDNNRIIFCSNLDNSSIRAVSLDDGSVSSITLTFHGKYDGLTRDHEGNIFISSWGYGTVYKWDSEFMGPPVLVSSGHDGAADIYFNLQDTVLCVPNIFAHTVDFLIMTDYDEDGYYYFADNCPNDFNPLQDDGDSDGIGNECDNCAANHNPDQYDIDEDEIGNACDNCPDDYNPLQEDPDEDSVGSACDNCPTYYNPFQEDYDHDDIGNICDFVCGDFDGDEIINILDIVYLIESIYKGGTAPTPPERMDANGDKKINILDVVYLINFIYKGGPEPDCLL